VTLSNSGSDLQERRAERCGSATAQLDWLRPNRRSSLKLALASHSVVSQKSYSWMVGLESAPPSPKRKHPGFAQLGFPCSALPDQVQGVKVIIRLIEGKFWWRIVSVLRCGGLIG
jgi:hypothetical protein